MAHLRLVEAVPTDPPSVISYENRMGVMYYLHEGRTKTGKPRYYVAQTVGEGRLTEMPEGFEICESVNGVVSVRRKDPNAVAVPPEDLKLVEEAIAKHPHLAGYMARIAGNAIIIFEPHPRPHELCGFADRSFFFGSAEGFINDRMRRARYDPVMKFERGKDAYVAMRMTYRGRGGWSWPLASGSLRDLARKLVKTIGTEEFYELL